MIRSTASLVLLACWALFPTAARTEIISSQATIALGVEPVPGTVSGRLTREDDGTPVVSALSGAGIGFTDAAGHPQRRRK